MRNDEAIESLKLTEEVSAAVIPDGLVDPASELAIDILEATKTTINHDERLHLIKSVPLGCTDGRRTLSTTSLCENQGVALEIRRA